MSVPHLLHEGGPFITQSDFCGILDRRPDGNELEARCPRPLCHRRDPDGNEPRPLCHRRDRCLPEDDVDDANGIR